MSGDPHLPFILFLGISIGVVSGYALKCLLDWLTSR